MIQQKAVFFNRLENMITKITETLIEFFLKLTGGNGSLTVVLVSMFPLIELKGAIPVGERLGLELWRSALMAYVGSTLVALPIFFLLIPLFNLLKRWKPLSRFVSKVENVFLRRAERISSGKDKQAAARRMLVLGVFAFVAVPLPLTGVWTGTAIAAFLGLRFREAAPAIVLGNLIAGSVITLLTFLFRQYVDIIIFAIFVAAIVMLAVFIIKVAVSKPGKDKAEAGKEEGGASDKNSQ